MAQAQAAMMAAQMGMQAGAFGLAAADGMMSSAANRTAREDAALGLPTAAPPPAPAFPTPLIIGGLVVGLVLIVLLLLR